MDDDEQVEQVVEFGDASDDESYGEPINPGIDYKDWIDIVLIVLVLIFICVLVYAMIVYDRDSVQCLSNPIAYFELTKNVTLVCKESVLSATIDFSKVEILNP